MHAHMHTLTSRSYTLHTADRILTHSYKSFLQSLAYSSQDPKGLFLIPNPQSGTQQRDPTFQLLIFDLTSEDHYILTDRS